MTHNHRCFIYVGCPALKLVVIISPNLTPFRVKKEVLTFSKRLHNEKNTQLLFREILLPYINASHAMQTQPY